MKRFSSAKVRSPHRRCLDVLILVCMPVGAWAAPAARGAERVVLCEEFTNRL